MYLFDVRVLSNTLKYHFSLPSHTLLCYHLSCVSKPFRLSLNHALTSHRRQHNPANLCPISTSSTTPLSFSMALWNCQSAVNKTDFISTFSLQSTLSILGLTKTWIRPEDSATISLPLTPHVKLAGVGALVCSFQIIGNTQPTLPYAITTHLNLMRLL